MPDKSQDVGKSMWDLAGEVEQDAAPMRPRRTVQPSGSSNVGADDPATLVAVERDAVDISRADGPAASGEPRQRKLRGLVAVGIALAAVGGTAFVYMQGTQAAKSDPVANAQISELPSISPAAYKPRPIRFGDALTSTSPDVAGKSLAQLVMAPATVSPVSALPTSEWQSAECSSCHTWTEERLCDQGKWYETHGDAAVKRIGHPYGGGFKRSLRSWAKQGCR